MMDAVISSNFPFLRVHVEVVTPSAQRVAFDVEPLVDTGFDGGLAVPRHLIPNSTTPVGESAWDLADGTAITAPTYLCFVTIGGLPPVPTVVIALGATPLLGRRVTDEFRVTFDHGRLLVVEQ